VRLVATAHALDAMRKHSPVQMLSLAKSHRLRSTLCRESPGAISRSARCGPLSESVDGMRAAGPQRSRAGVRPHWYVLAVLAQATS
jgi:hypothetical protein